MKSLQEMLAAAVMDYLTHEASLFAVVNENQLPLTPDQEKCMFTELIEMFGTRLENLPESLADPDLQQFAA